MLNGLHLRIKFFTTSLKTHLSILEDISNTGSLEFIEIMEDTETREYGPAIPTYNGGLINRLETVKESKTASHTEIEQ